MERNDRLDIQPGAKGGFDMPIRRIKGIVLGFMVFLGIVCAQEIAGPGAAAAADRVSLRLDWTPWSLHTFLFAAREKGFFRSEDLDVRLYTPAKPQDTLKLVGVGKDHFGLSYQTDTIIGRSEDLPVVSVAAIVQHPLNVMLTMKESGLTHPKQLKGKKIGSPMIPSDDAFLQTIAQTHGMTMKDFRVVNVGFNLVPPLLAGKVDAVIGTYWVWEKVQIELEGKQVNVIRLTDHGVPDFYESVLIASDDLIRKNPNIIRRFLRAADRGWKFVIRDPEAALNILLRKNKDLRPELARQAIQLLIPLVRNGVPKIGWQTEAKWRELRDYMLDSKLVRKSVPVKSLFTTSFLP
jgi:putative hydroxymethylpyrimidine transport system substrate-binding protein